MVKLMIAAPVMLLMLLFANSCGNHGVKLTWNPSTTPHVTYRLYRCAATATVCPLLASSIAGTTYTDSTVVSGQTYTYTATSFNGLESPKSNKFVAVIP